MNRKQKTCRYPQCARKGEMCTISVDDQSEAETILCEHHFEVVRGLGQ